MTKMSRRIVRKTDNQTTKQKKRPRAILRWFRRLWCRIRGIPYIEVYGSGDKARGHLNSLGNRSNIIIIDDMEEENNNDRHNCKTK